MGVFMNKKIVSQLKLFVPVFSLIIVLIFLGSIIISSNSHKINSLKKLDANIQFGNIISDILHSLQKERGLSGGFVSNGNNEFKIALIKQREKSDEAIKRLTSFLEKQPSFSFKKEIRKTLQYFNILSSLRNEVDQKCLSPEEVIVKYSAINTVLLNRIVAIAKQSHIPKITQNILAYSNFLFLKEYGGLARVQGVILFSQKHFDIDAYMKFSNLIALKKYNQELFLQNASNEIKARYYKVTDSKVCKKVEKLQKKILNRDFLKTYVNAQYWFTITTQTLDRLDSIGKFIKQDTLQKIKQEISLADNMFILVSLLTGLSILIFLIIVRVFFKLIKDEQRLRQVMDKYIISSTTNLKGVITDASEAFCKISGYSKEELIGQKHNIVRHPDMKKKVFRSLWKSLKKGEAWSGKIKNRKKDGNFYWVYANIEPLYNDKGEIDAYIAIRVNITELEELNLEMQEKNEEYRIQQELMQQQHRLAQMGEMISMIAHQWRQPLSAITAVTAAMQIKTKMHRLDEESTLEMLDKINHFSAHLSETINDFRNFFKPNKQQVETDYKKMLDSIFLMIENSLQIYNIKVSTNIGKLKTFRTYESEVKQVLLNLIKNAEDALVENKVKNPEIVIEINEMKCTISDNAGGIPTEIIDKIFDPYFSTKIKKNGTGLGLYMSKIIIEDHCGGILNVENSELGASFTIELFPSSD